MTERDAPVGLRRRLEEVWTELRADFALQDGSWLAFLFGVQAPEVAELVARTRDLARAEVRRVEELVITGLGDVAPALRRLLTPPPADVAATWVFDSGGRMEDRARVWTELLQRLNERRDVLLAAHRGGVLFACPSGMLPLVRDEAPDLWAFRSLVASLDVGGSVVSLPEVPVEPPAEPAGPNPLIPVPGPPIQPSDAVAPLLRRAASALRAGRSDQALVACMEASDRTAGQDDVTLVRAWLARVRDQQGEPVDAARHAQAALAARRPLEEPTTITLLQILSRCPDQFTAQYAATALAGLHRQLVRRHDDSPTALRDLSAP